ncbi:MAG: cytochrome c oxidase subunit [Phycisphaerales bacterium]|jgi:heme/copper-type cytochrome/quinol oxidase subunit 3|nr:cytochrome c oxidase subunit [Phycisphaerales bacterium]
MMQPRATIDASKLPDHAWDAHAPLWWGNLLLVFVETTSMALLFATYFYVRRNFHEWPPPRINEMPPIVHPVPHLAAATFNTILLLASCLPMYWTDMAARRIDRKKVILGLLLMIGVGVISSLLRWREFYDVHFRWDENAYGSIVWTMLGLHLIYILTGIAEFGLMAAFAARHGFEEKHALDVTLMGGFWYWLAGIWVITYVIIYWYPRWS